MGEGFQQRATCGRLKGKSEPEHLRTMKSRTVGVGAGLRPSPEGTGEPEQSS
jgi:hypothetical protein